MMAIAASLGAICPCVPPTATAPDEHSCCPDDALGMAAPQTECCAERIQGSATLATDGALTPPAWGVGAASILPPAGAAGTPAVPLPLLSHTPLVLRI